MRTGTAVQSSRRNRVDDSGRPRGRLMSQSVARIFRNAYVDAALLPAFGHFVPRPFLRDDFDSISPIAKQRLGTA